MENLDTPNSIRTISGQYIDVFNPNPTQIKIHDIAHALSNQCRFAGHTKKFYSVAQHCVLVADFCDKPDHLLEALLHDAAEAYLVDIPSPIKKRLPDYQLLEDELMVCIAEVFEFKWPKSKYVSELDRKVLELEWDSVVLDKPVNIPFTWQCWSPERSKAEFLKKYFQIKTIIINHHKND